MRWMLSTALVLSPLVAHATYVGPGLTGNDTGGIIPWTPENQQMAYSIASERCARYDKYARITSVNARLGNYIGFSCVWSPFARP